MCSERATSEIFQQSFGTIHTENYSENDYKSFYIKTKDNIDSPYCIIIAKPNVRFLLYGAATIHHIKGCPLEVCNTIMKDSTVVYSPASHSQITLCISNFNKNDYIELSDEEIGKIFSDMYSSKYSNKIQQYIEVQMDAFDPSFCTLFVLEKINVRYIDSITLMKRFHDLFAFKKANFTPGYPLNTKLRYMLEYLPAGDHRGFNESSDIAALFDKLKKSNVTLICGPRNAGKSTLVRHIVNKSLGLYNEPIYVLDCDVGQPEFTPSASVSLCRVSKPIFGPPFTHVLRENDEINILSQCFFGSLTPTDDPLYYVQCLSFVHRVYECLPNPKPKLIINTMGWTVNLGLTLLIETIKMVQPNLIVQLELPNNHKMNLPTLDEEFIRKEKDLIGTELSEAIFPHDIVRIVTDFSFNSIVLDSPYEKFRHNFKAIDHRELTLTSYLVKQLSNFRRSLPFSGAIVMPVLEHPAEMLINCVPYRVSTMLPAKKCSSSSEKSSNFKPCLAMTVLYPPFQLNDKDTNEPEEFTFEQMMNCFNASLIALLKVDKSDLTQYLFLWKATDGTGAISGIIALNPNQSRGELQLSF